MSTELSIDDDALRAFRRDGFVHLPQVLDTDEVQRFRQASERVHAEHAGLNPEDTAFRQIVNVWKLNSDLRDLTLHPRLAALATRLAGCPLRLWHDHMLAKAGGTSTPTEYHQDAPYWPHQPNRACLSAWVALVDVPVERGCMTFIPRQQNRHDIRAADLHDEHDLMAAAPDLVYAPRVTIPLRAGDATFHTGYTPHTANANTTDQTRFAHVVIWVDRDVKFNGASHVCTDPLHLAVGDGLPDEEFPPVP